MKFLREGTIFYTCECEECGHAVKVGIVDCTKTNNGYTTKYPNRCPNCRHESSDITYKEDIGENNEHFIKCPKCKSAQLTAGSKGFGLGKAAVGGLIMGPIGLLGGVIGSKKTMITCMRCGYKWQAGGN